ncbi:MAG: magnesium/cobalt efflux protein, partial [Xanthobacteraceae bacterium]
YVAARIGRVPVRGELVPGPGPFEIEILDADPRRVKKLKVYRGLDRHNGNSRETRRQSPSGAFTPASAGGSSTPVIGEEPVKLSPQTAPSKSARRS